MFEIFEKILNGQNNFASGGLLLMIIGAVGVYLREVPRRLWEWFVCQTTMTITVTNDDAAFVWVKEWLLEQEFMQRVRRLDLDTSLRGETIALVPAPGRHWFWHAGRPFVAEYYRSKETKGWSRKLNETLTVRTFGRNQEFLRQFVEEVVASHKRNNAFLFAYDEYWTRVLGYTPRLLESVILKPGEKEHLLQDIEQFRTSKKRYSELGVPYHRGYLLYGPPGTGKTSLASALAQKFAMSIYTVNLNHFNDRTLTIAINKVPPNSVILFEDIDCMSSGNARSVSGGPASNNSLSTREEKFDDPDRPGVTLSGVLNVLDGFGAPDNVLFIMTTNKIEVLDAALLRPGRIDYRLFMGKASDQQKVALYKRFFPSASESEARAFLECHRTVNTMAELQGVLLGSESDVPVRDMIGTEARAAIESGVDLEVVV